jgi:hypothetical protein
MVRKSRYFPADKSWTHTPAWAFEIPLRVIEPLFPHEKVVLKCETQERRGDYLTLMIPIDFLKKHINDFYLREDHQAISLFLSASDSDNFTELRGEGEVTFKQFLYKGRGHE